MLPKVLYFFIGPFLFVFSWYASDDIVRVDHRPLYLERVPIVRVVGVFSSYFF